MSIILNFLIAVFALLASYGVESALHMILPYTQFDEAAKIVNGARKAFLIISVISVILMFL